MTSTAVTDRNSSCSIGESCFMFQSDKCLVPLLVSCSGPMPILALIHGGFSLSLSLSLSLSRSIERPKRKMSRLSELQEADCVCVCLGLACLCFFFQGLCKRSGKKSWAPKSCAPNSFCNPEVKSPVQTSETEKKELPPSKSWTNPEISPMFFRVSPFRGLFSRIPPRGYKNPRGNKLDWL